jgi:hypothetical protein
MLAQSAIARDQSAMSRLAGGFLGAAVGGDGAGSALPALTDEAGPDPLDLSAGEPLAAVLRRAASAGRGRGIGGDFRSTWGIGIGGTNRSSFCATGIANRPEDPDMDRGTGGAARASLNAAADTKRQRQNLMARDAVTLTIFAPAR